MYCKNCGARLAEDGSKTCMKCGAEKGKGTGFCPNCGTMASRDHAYCGKCGAALYLTDVSDRKSRMAAGFMAIFFGCFGVHNFYLGHTGRAVLQLAVTVLSVLSARWALYLLLAPVVIGAWGLLEGILLLAGVAKVDGRGNLLRE